MYVIDSISPVKQVRIKTNTKPWFDGIVLEAIHVRDKLRKKYKKSGLQIDFKMLNNMPDIKKKRKNVYMLRISSEQILLSRQNFGRYLSRLVFLRVQKILQRYVLRTAITHYFLSLRRPATYLKIFMKTLHNHW